MIKITENALLFRVKQLTEKLAIYEDASMDAAKQRIATRKQGEAAAAATAAANKNADNSGVLTDPNAFFQQLEPTAQQPVANQQTQQQPVANQQTQQQPVTPHKHQHVSYAQQELDAKKASGQTTQPTQQGTSAKPTTATPPGKWPTTRDEIIAFQKVNKDQFGKPLATDGLIGAQTMQALARAGIQPPAGFQMAGNKPAAAAHPAAAHPAAAHPAAAHPAAAHPAAAQKAAPGTAGYVNPDGTVSSGNAQTDANLAANAAYVNLPSDEQHAINMYHGQQSQKTAASQQAVAQGQSNLNSPDTLTRNVAQAANAAIPATPPSTASTAQGPLGVNFQGMRESVTFGQEDSLARIIQLAKW